MSSRGLPGFLRRSLRLTTARDEEEEEEDDDNDEVQNEVMNHSNDTSNKNDDDNNIKYDDVNDDSHDFSTNDHRVKMTPPNQQHHNNNDNSNTNNSNNQNSSNRSMNSTESKNLSDSCQDVIPPIGTIPTTTTNSTTTFESYPDSPTPSILSNNNNNNNNVFTTKKTYREQQYEKILSMDVIHMHDLRALAWNGIPIQYRAMVWKLLLGYVPTNGARRENTIQRKRSEYQEAIVQYYNENDDDDDDDDEYRYSNRNTTTMSTTTTTTTTTSNSMSRHRTVQEQETLRQVLVDVPRTQPQIPLFRNHRIQQSLSRILYIWALRHPASSYVQGINDLVTPLLTIFLADYYIHSNHTSQDATSFSATTNTTTIDQQQQQLQQVLDGHVMNHCSEERLQHVEADVYWCLTNLLSSIQDHYTADQPGLQRMVGRLEELVYRIDKDLTVHIRDDIGIQFLQFSFKWMNCLLLREFHLKCIFRLWDTYLSEKDGFEDFHVYVCAAFMCQFSHQLQTMNFDELFGFMQDIPTNDWTDTEIEVLLSQAFVLSTLFKGSDAHLTNNSTSM